MSSFLDPKKFPWFSAFVAVRSRGNDLRVRREGDDKMKSHINHLALQLWLAKYHGVDYNLSVRLGIVTARSERKKPRKILSKTVTQF